MQLTVYPGSGGRHEDLRISRTHEWQLLFYVDLSGDEAASENNRAKFKRMDSPSEQKHLKSVLERHDWWGGWAFY